MISFVIVTYNSRGTIGRCLDHVKDVMDVSDEVIVVDNDSRDGTQALVSRDYGTVLVIQTNKNGGFSYGVNIGVARTRGDTIFLLNPDAYIRSIDRNAITARLSSDQIGVIGPKVIDDHNGKRQLSARRFPTLKAALFNRYSLISRLMPNNRFSREYLDPIRDEDRPQDVDWVSGCAMIFKKGVFNAVGGFDERFFVFQEDVDFCLRLKQAGYRVLYCPDAVVAHEIGISKNSPSMHVNYQRHRSIWLYYRKHFNKNIFLMPLVFFGVCLRFIAITAVSIIKKCIAKISHPPAE